jgi:CheY-like chemotaxis protein
MTQVTRPPPSVLFVHNGAPVELHIKHLTDAGLRVSEAHADEAVGTATALKPDIIVLDFDCDGETTALLKSHPPTRDIPIIALVELLRPR